MASHAGGEALAFLRALAPGVGLEQARRELERHGCDRFAALEAILEHLCSQTVCAQTVCAPSSRDAEEDLRATSLAPPGSRKKPRRRSATECAAVENDSLASTSDESIKEPTSNPAPGIKKAKLTSYGDLSRGVPPSYCDDVENSEYCRSTEAHTSEDSLAFTCRDAHGQPGQRNKKLKATASEPPSLPELRSDGTDACEGMELSPFHVHKESLVVDLRCGLEKEHIDEITVSALEFLMRVQAAFEWRPAGYYELIQALHLRHSAELGAQDCTSRAKIALVDQLPLWHEFEAAFQPSETNSPIVLAALMLHGSLPQDKFPSHPATVEDLADAGNRWTVSPRPMAHHGIAAGLATLEHHVGQPPSWTEKAVHGDRVLRLLAPLAAIHRDGIERDMDHTTYRVILSIGEDGHRKDDLLECRFRWWWPLANPGTEGGWIGIFHAGADAWRSLSSRAKYKRINRDAATGVLRFTRSELRGLPDGEYEAALIKGKWAVATTSRFRISDGAILHSSRLAGMTTPCVDVLRATHHSRTRQKVPKSIALVTHGQEEVGVDEDELHDERCLFDVPRVDVHVAGPLHARLLKRMYRLVESASYLDWGLTSDFDAGATQGRISRGNGSIPQQQRLAADKGDAPRGLGGNTRGSEGYGELTAGSVHRICSLLNSLRDCLLVRLRPDGWVRAWDLTSESSFVDIGSGFGKVVMHVALEVQVRRAVGIECVVSRHEIARHVLQEIRSEILLDPELTRSFHQEAEPASLVHDEKLVSRSRTDETTKDQEPRISNACISANQYGAACESQANPSEPIQLEPRHTDTNPQSTLMNNHGMTTTIQGTDATEDGGVDIEASSNSVIVHTKTGTAECPQQQDTPDPFESVFFHFGDATLGSHLDFSHIYVFDRVFSPRTLCSLARVLMASPFLVLISYRTASEWWQHGLSVVQPVAKIRVQTTGKETMNAYVYINMRYIPP